MLALSLGDLFATSIPAFPHKGKEVDTAKRRNDWLCLWAVCLLPHPGLPPQGEGGKHRRLALSLGGLFAAPIPAFGHLPGAP